MSENKERNLTVIESVKTETETKVAKKKVSWQTNPIAKKFLDFHRENAGKFSVKDLFRK